MNINKDKYIILEIIPTHSEASKGDIIQLQALKIIDITIYITPISSAISIICFTLALFKVQLSDTVPIALTKVVDRMSDGYLVLNEKNIITDYNLTLLKMFEIEDKSISSTHIFDLLNIDAFKGLEEKTERTDPHPGGGDRHRHADRGHRAFGCIHHDEGCHRRTAAGEEGRVL